MRRGLAIALFFAVACAHREPVPEVKSVPPPPKPTAPPPAPDEWPRLASRVLEREKPKLRDCYEREVREVEDSAAAGTYAHGEKVPSLSGKLVLVLPVEADGSVSAPRIEQDSLRNTSVSRCLVEQAKGIHFAPPADGEPVELTVPFSFQLKGPAD